MKITNKVYILVRCAAIAALYFCLNLLLAPISFGTIQFRVSEALCMMPFVFPETSIGLFIGCIFSNLSSPFGLWDIVIGSLVTLIAGILTSKIKNVWLAPLSPILLNAFILPFVWSFFGAQELYIINVLSLLVSQSVILYGGGVPLAKQTQKLLDKGALK